MPDRKQRITGALAAGAVIVGALANAGATGAFASEPARTAADPPDGARAVVQVSPNPTAERGEEVTITGSGGGGERLRAVHSGFNGKPVLENVRIVNDDPAAFTAKGTVSREIGDGVGPVLVDCGGQAGVTLLITHT